MEGFKPQITKYSTIAIHAGCEPEKWNSMAVVPPISLSTTFKQDGPAQFRQYEYSRSGNPTRDCLEQCLAPLEEGKHALTFASGLAATTTAMHLLEQGDHMVAGDDVYGGTNRLFRRVLSRNGVTVEFKDSTNVANIIGAIKPNTKMVWLESPTNPTLKLTDIEALSTAVHAANKDIIVVVDNTFLSPYYQQPLTLGADLVLHSMTKYLGGHSDLVMGCLVTRRDDLHDRLRFLQNAIGTVPAPYDCYNAIRSLKTLPVRMQRHGQNGLAVARFLEKHPAVEKVLHPGLPSHPQHELAKRQSYGHSGMITMYIKGDMDASKRFFDNIKVFTLAESLGGYESLCELPSVMTHASVSAEERAKLGITDSLIRLSVGLEDESDLIQDLDTALKAAVQV